MLRELEKRYKYRITVFTPTFNRGYILHNLYKSLQRQSFRNFEWIIVDDGSKDNTSDIVKEWINRGNNFFEIKYFKQKNGGKHRAINRGLDMSEGEIFFTVDSDDYLTDDALSKINQWFEDIKDYNNIKGIVANRGYDPENTVNPLFKESYLDLSLLEMNTYQENDKMVLGGERAICFYTDFHRKYKFPEFAGENFMTEAVVYNRMANDGYEMRFYNDIIWLFEYREDGLSAQGSNLYLKNPRGYGLWLREEDIFRKRPIFFKIKRYYSFTCDLMKLYDIDVISKSIGTSKWMISLMIFIHKIRNKGKKS